MAQETLVVLVDLVVDESLLTRQLRRYGMFEALDYLLEDRLVEHQLLALHDGHHIATGQQFATLQDNAIGTSIEHVDPQLLVQDLAREDEDAHLRIGLLGLTTDLDAYGGGTTQPQVEQYEVGLLLLDETPEAGFIVGSTNDLRLGNLVAYDAFRAFEFEGHVLDNNELKFFHYIWVK